MRSALAPWRLDRRLVSLCARPATVALSVYLAGCNVFANLAINSIYADNPSPTVRDSTKITIAASTFPGRTIHYHLTAARGRIYQDVDTDDTVVYYAPFTSQAPDPSGSTTMGDQVQVEVSDGSSTVYKTLTINLTGDSVVFQEDSGDCSSATSDSSQDCNGPLYAGTVDSFGSSVSDVRPLTDSNGNALVGAEPTISPDGKRVAYVYYPGNGTSAIYTVDAAGYTSNLTAALPSDGFNLDPSWAPFGDQLAFASDRDNSGVFDIYRMPADQQNGPATRVTTNSSTSVRYPSWNPTGANANLLLASADAVMGGQNNLVANPAWNVFEVNLATGQFMRQLSNLSEIGDYAVEAHWDPTGQSVAYTQRGPAPGTASTADAARFLRVVVQCADSSPGGGELLNPTEQTGTSLAESNPMWNPENGTQVSYLRYQIDSQGNVQGTPAFYMGNPPALCGSTQPGLNSQGPRQWGDITQQVLPFHMLSTSRLPVGGDEVDWR